MRAAAFAFALMLSGAAVAQTANTTGNMDQQTPTGATGDVAAPADTTTTTSTTDTTMAMNAAPAAGAVVEPSNANPERDARGIPVISLPAMVPIGYNGVQGEAMGGPEVDPATGQTVDTTASYPPCTRTVTDKCLQTYERHRVR